MLLHEKQSNTAIPQASQALDTTLDHFWRSVCCWVNPLILSLDIRSRERSRKPWALDGTANRPLGVRVMTGWCIPDRLAANRSFQRHGGTLLDDQNLKGSSRHRITGEGTFESR